MLSVILIVTALIGYIVIVAVYWSQSKPSGNLWFGVTLPALRHSFLRTHKAFAEMKRTKDWFVGDKRIVRLDTKLSHEKQKMKLPLYWFILPALIAALPYWLADPDIKHSFCT